MVADEPVRNGFAKAAFWRDVIQGIGDNNIRIGCDCSASTRDLKRATDSHRWDRDARGLTGLIFEGLSPDYWRQIEGFPEPGMQAPVAVNLP
jgi:hypothetical protein